MVTAIAAAKKPLRSRLITERSEQCLTPACISHKFSSIKIDRFSAYVRSASQIKSNLRHAMVLLSSAPALVVEFSILWPLLEKVFGHQNLTER